MKKSGKDKKCSPGLTPGIECRVRYSLLLQREVVECRKEKRYGREQVTEVHGARIGGEKEIKDGQYHAQCPRHGPRPD